MGEQRSSSLLLVHQSMPTPLRLTVPVNNVAAMQVHKASRCIDRLQIESSHRVLSSRVHVAVQQGVWGHVRKRHTAHLQLPRTIASRRGHVSCAAAAGLPLAAHRQSYRLPRAQYSVISAGGNRHSPAQDTTRQCVKSRAIQVAASELPVAKQARRWCDKQLHNTISVLCSR